MAKPEFVFRFDSVSALLSHFERVPLVRGNRYADNVLTGHPNYSWSFGVSHSQAKELARTGWTEGADRIARQAAPMVNAIRSQIYVPEPYFDVDGSSIDMARYLQGDPECFLDWRESDRVDESRTGRLVHVVANLGVSASFSADAFYAKGVATAVLVDCLEHSGRRVILDVGHAHDPDNLYYECSVRIKNADEPVNPELVAFAVAHPAFTRRLLHAVEGTMPINPGMMAPSDVRMDGDIIISASSSDITRNPLGWAIEQLKEQGIEFTEFTDSPA